MFGIKKRVEIFKKKDKETWSEIKKALSEDGTVKFKSGHYFSETVSHGGCGAKLDPRNFGGHGTIDRDIYWIKVNEEDADRAREVLLKAGIAPTVDEHASEDAYKRVAEKQDHYFE